MKPVNKFLLFIFTIFFSLSLVNSNAAAVGEPVNDGIATALDLGVTQGATVSTSGSKTGNTNANATVETDEINRAMWDRSVWFKAKFSAGNWDIAISAGTSWDTMLVVGTLTNPSLSSPFQNNNFIETKFNDDSDESLLSRVSFTADGTSTYYIGVGGFEGASGGFTLEYSKLATLSNDNIAQATVVTPPTAYNIPTTMTGQHNIGATIETGANETQRLASPTWSKSVWYKMTPTVTDTYKLRVNRTFEGVSVVLKKSFTDNTFVEADVLRQTTSSTIGTQLLNSGTTYYFAIGSNTNDEGSFSFTVTRVAVPTQVSNVQFTTGVNPSVTWTAPTPPTGASWQLSYIIYLEHLVEPLFREVTTSSTTTSFQRLHPGTWSYTISPLDELQSIDGNAATGTFIITTASNDFFSSATALSGDTGTTTDTFAFATRELGEPAHSSAQLNSSLWYRFTPSSTGSYTMTVNAQGTSPNISVYSGNSLGTITRIGTSIDSATWPGSGGVTYFIAVTTADQYRNTDGGTYSLSWSTVVTTPAPPPPVIAAPPVAVVTTTPAAVDTTTTSPVVTSLPTSTPPALFTTPTASTVKTARGGKNSAPLSIAKKAMITVPKAATVSASIKNDSKKVCSLVAGKLQFKKKATCNVTIKVTPKKGKATSHAVAVSP